MLSQTFRNFAPQKFAVVGFGHFLGETSQFCRALAVGEVGTQMGVRADTGWDHRRSGSAPGLSKKLAPQVEIGPRTLRGRWSPTFREPPISLERVGAKTKIEPVERLRQHPTAVNCPLQISYETKSSCAPSLVYATTDDEKLEIF